MVIQIHWPMPQDEVPQFFINVQSVSRKSNLFSWKYNTTNVFYLW